MWFEDADYFLGRVDCSVVSDEADQLLVEIEENGLMEVFGQWMFKNAGDYCDVDGYEYDEMIRSFCRLKEIVKKQAVTGLGRVCVLVKQGDYDG